MSELLPVELLQDVIKKLGVDARHVDVRVSTTDRQDLRGRNARIDSISESSDNALGIRVLHRNGWGFAAASEVTEQSLRETATRALELARASHLATTDEIVMHEVDAVQASVASPFAIDPWSIPIEHKAETLLEALQVIRSSDRIHQASGELSSYRQSKLLVSSDGSVIRQTTTETGGGIEAVAMDGDEFQRRNYPNPVGGDYAARGWEFIQSLALTENAARIRDEVLALLTAPKSPAGRYDLVIGSSQLALQIHESCGHPAELDRALGWEISLAGGSFLQPSMLGSFRYGSELVTLVADATVPHSIGSFAFDDDGVAAQRTALVDRGIFVDYLTGRDTAPGLGRRSNGTVRAESAARIPLIRMTNINLEPGDAALADIIASTKRGIFVDTNKSWSIDDLRLNFQFSCEVAWEIVDGKLGRLLRNPLYTGNTPDFWRSCDMIGDQSTWQLWGLPNCGKGDPMQTMRVAHGAPVARFRDVEMG